MPQPHLHAIYGPVYTQTELVSLATFTLPEALQCSLCATRYALITDQVNTVRDERAMAAFAMQIGLLQHAVDEDHSAGHASRRFVSDGVTVSSVPYKS
jgi:hypothetical protein